MSTSGAGAKEQVARLLTLVPYLHTRGEVRLDDAARELGLSPQQLLRDLRVLLMCGLPGGYPGDLIDVDLDALEDPDGDGVIRVSNADYLARPLRLTPTEASALIVALRAMRDGSDDQTREVLDRTLSKLEVAAAGGADQVDVGDRVDALATLRARLADAVDRGRQVRLTYYVPARDELSDRVVDPHRLQSVSGFDYLDAWCHSAAAPRLFRLDRIESAEVLTSPVETPAPSRRPLADGLFLQDAEALKVTLRLQPQARWVPDYYPVDSLRRRRGGVLDVTMLIADPRWLDRLLLRLAPYATVLDPPDLAASLRSTAAAALSLYTDHPHP